MVRLLFVPGKNFSLYRAGIFIFCLFAWTKAKCPGGADDMKALHKKLMYDYNPVVRPSRNYSNQIDVSIELHISIILGLHTKNQVLYLRAFIRVMWTDEYLQWNQTDHGCIKRIVVPQNTIWKPDLMLYNAANEHDSLGDEKIFTSVSSAGFAKWEPYFYLEGTCKLDMTKYPFDVSLCPVHISSWMTDNESMIMKWPDNPVNIDHMIINGEYEVTSGGATKVVTAFDDQFFETVTFNIRLARRPLYVLVSLLLPVNMLAILGILSFLMPPDESEKVTVSITVFLSFTVFLAFLNANIPSASDNIPLLVIYVTALLIMSFLSVVGNVLVVTVKAHSQCHSAILHYNRDTNTQRQHDNAIISYINNPQADKSKQQLFNPDNVDSLSHDPSQTQVFVKAERNIKHQIFNTNATKLNKLFLIVNSIALLFMTCLMLAFIIL